MQQPSRLLKRVYNSVELLYISKLLYILHITSVLDALEISKIAGHSKMDGTLAKLEDLILGSKTYIHSWNPHPSTIKGGVGPSKN